MDGVDATIEQVKRLVALLPDGREIPLFVFDAGYDGIALGHGLADTRGAGAGADRLDTGLPS